LIKEKILLIKEDYKKLLKEKSIISDKVAIKSAYVVFRSMEAAARAKEIYSKTIFTRFWLYITCRENEYRSTYLLDRYLKVRKAEEPTLILWENLGYNMVHRAWRIIFTSCVASGLVIACIFVSAYGTVAD